MFRFLFFSNVDVQLFQHYLLEIAVDCIHVCLFLGSLFRSIDLPFFLAVLFRLDHYSFVVSFRVRVSFVLLKYCVLGVSCLFL